jgi:hypothetical protein
MKFNKFRTIFQLLLVVVSINLGQNLVLAQEETELDPLRFYRAKYDLTFSESFDIVKDAVTAVLEDIQCLTTQNVLKTDKDGFNRQIIKSDFCVFVEGDSTFNKLRTFSKEMPFIRGGTWKNGRMQYSFVITEQADGSTYLLLKGNLSGFENYVTNKVHFWESNGQLEQAILDAITEKVKKLAN